MHWDKEVALQLNQLLGLNQAQAGPIIGIIAEHRQNAYNQGYKKASDDVAAVAAQKSTKLDWSESTTGAVAYFTKGGKTYKVEVHYCIETALAVAQNPKPLHAPLPAFTWNCRTGGFTIDRTLSYPTVRMAMDAAEQILKEIGLIDGQHNHDKCKERVFELESQVDFLNDRNAALVSKNEELQQQNAALVSENAAMWRVAELG